MQAARPRFRVEFISRFRYRGGTLYFAPLPYVQLRYERYHSYTTRSVALCMVWLFWSLRFTYSWKSMTMHNILRTEQYTFHGDGDHAMLHVFLLLDHTMGTMSISPDTLIEDAQDDQPSGERSRFQKRVPAGCFLFYERNDATRWVAIAQLIQHAAAFGARRLSDVKKESDSALPFPPAVHANLA